MVGIERQREETGRIGRRRRHDARHRQPRRGLRRVRRRIRIEHRQDRVVIVGQRAAEQRRDVAVDLRRQQRIQLALVGLVVEVAVRGLVEIRTAEEAGELAAVVVVEAQFLAELVAPGVLVEFDEVGLRAVGVELVEGFVTAPAGDGGQRPGVVEGEVAEHGGAVDFAVGAEVFAALRIGGVGVEAALFVRDDHAAEAGARRRVLLVVQDHVDAAVRADVEVQCAAQRTGVLALQGAAVEVLDVAIAGFVERRDAALHVVADVGVVVAGEAALVVAAQADLETAAATGAGLVLDQVYGAGLGGAAEQGALRPAQDFHALHIEHFDRRAARAADRHAVLEQRDARLLGGVVEIGGDAADRDAGVVDALGLDFQAGHQRAEIAVVVDALGLQELAGIGVDRDRHVLDLLLALLRGDHDPVQRIGIARGGAVLGGGGQGPRGRQRRREGERQAVAAQRCRTGVCVAGRAGARACGHASEDVALEHVVTLHEEYGSAAPGLP